MKYATLLLGLAIVLASIVTARAEVLVCDNGVSIEREYKPTCPTSVPEGNCRSFRFAGYSIYNLPLTGFDLRITTKTPRRGISTDGPDPAVATLNGKRCRIEPNSPGAEK